MKRTIVYSLLACAAIAVIYLPPEPRTFDPGAVFRSPERNFALRLNIYVRRQADALVLLAQRDTAMTRLGPLGSHSFFASPELPVRLDSATRQLLADPDSVPAHEGAPVIAVAAIVDTVRRLEAIRRIPPRRGPRIYYLPPSATDGQTCLSVAAIGPDLLRQVLETPDEQLMAVPWTRNALLGLCEFYHRFGRPSPPVEAWLIAGAIAYDGGLVSRCGKGDLDACAVLALPEAQRRMPVGVTFAIGRRGPPGTLPSFDGTDELFLNTIIDSLGAGPFEHFWREPESVVDGFEANFGMPMVEWVRAWFENRAFGPVMDTGPRPTQRMLLLSIATIAVSLAWAVVARSGSLARSRAPGLKGRRAADDSGLPIT